MEECREGCVTGKGNVLQHVLELPKVYHQRYLETWVFFSKEATVNQLISWFVSWLPTNLGMGNTYLSYQKLNPLAGILPKTPTQTTVCRHDVYYSFSLLHLCYFQPRLENQHFFYLICPYALALHIKFFLFQKFILIVIPELLLYSGTHSLHSLPFDTNKRENNSFG